MIRPTVHFALAAAVIAASVTSPSATAAPSCTPTRDLIIWQRAPQLIDSAFEVGNYGIGCALTLDAWASEQPTGPGYCNRIAWADDNPGYDVDARPAPALKKVIESVGDAC